MATIKSSNKLVDSIKGEEGFVAKPYVDADGVLAQGYGDTLHEAKGVIDEVTASARLKENVGTFESELSDRIKREDLNSNQQDALLDAAYNVGTTNLESYGLFDAINTKDDAKVRKILGSITKAKDPKTGKLRELKGLVERSKRRTALWDTPVEDDEFIDGLIDDVQGSGEDDEFIDGLIDEVSKEDKVPSMIDPRTANTIEEHKTIAEADELDPERQRQVEAYASKFKIAEDEADALLDTGESFKDDMAAPDLKLAENNYKGIAKWAKPENYHLLRDNLDFFKDTEKIVSSSYASSLGKAFKRSGLEGKRLVEFLKISIANNTPEGREAMILELERLDKEKLKHIEHKYQDGLKKVQEGASGIARFMRPLDNLINAGFSIYEGDRDTARKELIKALVDFKGLKEDQNSNIHVKLWEMADTIKNNPGATGIMAAESSVSSLAPLAGGVLGFASQIPSGTAAGSFAGGYLVSFYQFLSEESQGFARKDGTIDYRKFFSDPERMGKLKRKATAYGFTHGAVDAFLTKIGGKGIVGKLSKPVEAAKEFGKRTAGNIAGEMAGETAASLAAGKGFEESVKQGVLEGPAAGISGTGFTVFGIAREAWDQRTHEEKFDRYIKTVDKVIKAKNNKKSLQAAREVFTGSEVPKSNPEQLKKFVKDVFATASEEETSEDPTVHFDIKEWNEYHEELGLDPAEAVALLGEAAVAAYTDAVSNGVSFQVPYADYIIKSEGNPELDDIARISDDDMSNREADTAFEEIDSTYKDFLDIGDDKGDDDVEPITFKQDDREPEQGEPVLRPVELYKRFRNKQHQKVHEGLGQEFTKSLKDSLVGKDMSPEDFTDFVDYATEMEFRRIRNRSDILGRTIEEVAEDRPILFDETMTGYTTGRFRINHITGKGKVLFGPNSTAKTVVHELGHSWLHELSLDWKFIHGLDHNTLTPAQAAYKQSMQTTLELVNKHVIAKHNPLETLEGIASGAIGNTALEAVHETFAQTTEAYFMEGKFANNRIRQMMEQMRVWVKKVFEGLSYKHLPPFDMTPEVERLFEGIIGISTQVEEEVNEMFATPMFTEEMMGKDWAAYRDAILDARAGVVGEIYSRSTVKSWKAKEAQVDKAIDALVLEAASEIDKLESVQMTNQLQAMEDTTRISTEDLRRQILISVGIPSGALPKNFKIADIAKEFPNITRPDGVVMGTETYLKAQMKGLPKNIRTRTRTAPFVNHFMSMFGIVDRQKFLDMLQEAGAYDELVANKTRQLIKEKMPVFKSEEEIHVEAVEAVATKGPDKLMALELKKLVNQDFPAFKKLNKMISLPPTHQRRANVALLKAEAKKLVNAAKESIKPMAYFKTSQKAGKIAADLLASGDIVSAIDYKQKQILYYEAFAEATKVQKQITKAKGLIKRVMKNENGKQIAKYYDVDIYKFARKAVFLAENGLEIPEFEIGAVDSPYSSVDYSGVQMINDAIDILNSEVVGKRIAGTPFTNNNRIVLGSMVQQLLAMARDQKVVEIAGQIHEREEYAAAIVNSIGPRKAGDPKTSAYGGTGFKANITTFRTVLAGLYKDEKAFAASPFMALFDDAANAEADLILHKNEGITGLAKALAAIAKKDEGLSKIITPLVRRMGDLSVEGVAAIGGVLGREQDARDKAKELITQISDQTIPATELGVTFDSIGEVMMVLLHSGSQSGRTKFLRGGLKGSGEIAGIDPSTGLIDDTKLDAFFKRLVDEGVLTEDHFTLAETVWGFFDKHYTPSKEAIRHIYGYDIGRIEPKSFEVKFPNGETRTVSGGYIPASQSTEYVGLVDGDFSIEEENNFTHDLFPQSNIAFSNQRTQAPYELSLSLEFLPSQYNRVLQAAYLKKPMYEIGKIFSDETVEEAMEARRPGAMKQVVVPWFKRAMAQQYSRPVEGGEVPFNALARVVRKNVYTSAFLGNLSSFIQQFSGAPQAAAIIPAKYLAGASAKLAMSGAKDIAKGEIVQSTLLNEIADKSKRMNVRFKMSQKQFALSHDKLDLNGDWVSWTNEKVEAATFGLIQYSQSRTDIIVWSAAEEYAINELGLTGKKAIAYADNVVERTQGSANLTSRAGILDGPEYKRLFTSFVSFNITQYGIIEEQSMRHADKSSARKFQKKLQVLLYMAMVPAAVTAALFAAKAPKEDDREKRRKKRKGEDGYLNNMGSFMAEEYINANFPILGRSAIAVYKKDLGGILPAGRTLVSAGRGLDGFTQTAQGVQLTPSVIRDMDKTVTMITGLPILSPIAWWYRIKEITEDPKKRRHRNRSRLRQLKRLEREKQRKNR